MDVPNGSDEQMAVSVHDAEKDDFNDSGDAYEDLHPAFGEDHDDSDRFFDFSPRLSESLRHTPINVQFTVLSEYNLYNPVSLHPSKHLHHNEFRGEPGPNPGCVANADILYVSLAYITEAAK